ncbi:25 kDa translation elongation factor 1-beta [Perkinsela sp. CCAP 1560/4]|nr:25 kDa translation elongation factor 1-beta [Perkinsela sp. CCAP 1560/4]|eukprot:KNH03794.1 25 kDa translation elongation factor 1-beta [Perkinsela sp. CCAP 1560/4]
MSTASIAQQVKGIVTEHIKKQTASASDLPSEKDIELFQNLLLEGNEKDRSFIVKKMKGIVSWIDRMSSLKLTQKKVSEIESKLTRGASSGSMFLGGNLPGADDVAQFNALFGEENIALHRWMKHMASFSAEERQSFATEANTKDAITFSGKV